MKYFHIRIFINSKVLLKINGNSHVEIFSRKKRKCHFKMEVNASLICKRNNWKIILSNNQRQFNKQQYQVSAKCMRNAELFSVNTYSCLQQTESFSSDINRKNFGVYDQMFSYYKRSSHFTGAHFERHLFSKMCIFSKRTSVRRLATF